MNPWKISTYVLCSALAVAVGGTAFADKKKDDVAEKKKDDKKDDDKKADQQPNMMSALQHLELAKDKLEKATADKGGHRVKAIKLVKEAIEETNEGIKWDAEHISKDEKAKEVSKSKK